jgi:hypothetical protein
VGVRSTGGRDMTRQIDSAATRAIDTDRSSGRGRMRSTAVPDLEHLLLSPRGVR